MSDDSIETPSEPVAKAPAVHTDAMWDGPRKLISLPDDSPVIETKTQYFHELNRLGFRLKDQQESSTGPEREIVLPPAPKPRPTPPLTKAQAEAFGAGTAVLFKHDIKRSFWCPACFTLGRESDYCHSVVFPRLVALQCGCGHQAYELPVGEESLSGKFAHTTHTLNDHTSGSLLFQHGQVMRPTTLLQRPEAEALIGYAKALHQLGLNGRWFCARCWDKRSLAEEASMGVKIAPDQIVFFCDCRMLFYQG